MTDKKIGILGLGTLGRAVAATAAAAQTEVVAWSRSSTSRQHQAPGEEAIELPDSVQLLEDPIQVVEQTRLVFFALPAYGFADVVAQVGEVARGDHFWVHGTKGVGEDGQLMHELIRSQTCVKQIAAIGGPILASELSHHGSAGLVAASRFDCAVDTLEAALNSNGGRLHRTRDIVGIEVAGALRNVISIAAGMASGMGETVRSAILARGLVETARFGSALGASPNTFVGIAGVGDLIARRQASSSRNYQLGERCAHGETPSAVLDDIDGPVEGAITARAIAARADKLNISMPLTAGVADVIDEKTDCKKMLQQILASDPGLGAGDSLV